MHYTILKHSTVHHLKVQLVYSPIGITNRHQPVVGVVHLLQPGTGILVKSLVRRKNAKPVPVSQRSSP